MHVKHRSYSCTCTETEKLTTFQLDTSLSTLFLGCWVGHCSRGCHSVTKEPQPTPPSPQQHNIGPVQILWGPCTRHWKGPQCYFSCSVTDIISLGIKSFCQNVVCLIIMMCGWGLWRFNGWGAGRFPFAQSPQSFYKHPWQQHLVKLPAFKMWCLHCTSSPF